MALTACLPTAEQLDVAQSAPSSAERGIVTSVFDGDTVAVETGSDEALDVRLAGINAPEDDECHHDESLDYLQNSVGGKEVTFEVSGTDQFGRYLAHVWADGRHVNRELVAAGQALATTPDEGDPYGDSLLDAEEAAAEAAVGIWASDACGRSDQLPALTILEVDQDPAGRDEDALEGERVIIANRGEAEVDLSGWMLRDESSRHRYEFPRGTLLGEGETITVTSADPGWRPGGSPVWNNGGDLVLVLDPSGRIVAHRRY